MVDIERKFVYQYYDNEKYKNLRFLMPSIVDEDNKNYTDSIYLLKQACWVFLQIHNNTDKIRAKMQKDKVPSNFPEHNTALTNDQLIAVDMFERLCSITSEDIQLLYTIMKIGENKFNENKNNIVGELGNASVLDNYYKIIIVSGFGLHTYKCVLYVFECFKRHFTDIAMLDYRIYKCLTNENYLKKNKSAIKLDVSKYDKNLFYETSIYVLVELFRKNIYLNVGSTNAASQFINDCEKFATIKDEKSGKLIPVSEIINAAIAGVPGGIDATAAANYLPSFTNYCAIIEEPADLWRIGALFSTKYQVHRRTNLYQIQAEMLGHNGAGNATIVAPAVGGGIAAGTAYPVGIRAAAAGPVIQAGTPGLTKNDIFVYAKNATNNLLSDSNDNHYGTYNINESDREVIKEIVAELVYKYIEADAKSLEKRVIDLLKTVGNLVAGGQFNAADRSYINYILGGIEGGVFPSLGSVAILTEILTGGVGGSPNTYCITPAAVNIDNHKPYDILNDIRNGAELNVIINKIPSYIHSLLGAIIQAGYNHIADENGKVIVLSKIIQCIINGLVNRGAAAANPINYTLPNFNAPRVTRLDRRWGNNFLSISVPERAAIIAAAGVGGANPQIAAIGAVGALGAVAGPNADIDVQPLPALNPVDTSAIDIANLDRLYNYYAVATTGAINNDIADYTAGAFAQGGFIGQFHARGGGAFLKGLTYQLNDSKLVMAGYTVAAVVAMAIPGGLGGGNVWAQAGTGAQRVAWAAGPAVLDRNDVVGRNARIKPAPGTAIIDDIRNEYLFFDHRTLVTIPHPNTPITAAHHAELSGIINEINGTVSAVEVNNVKLDETKVLLYTNVAVQFDFYRSLTAHPQAPVPGGPQVPANVDHYIKLHPAGERLLGSLDNQFNTRIGGSTNSINIQDGGAANVRVQGAAEKLYSTVNSHIIKAIEVKLNESLTTKSNISEIIGTVAGNFRERIDNALAIPANPLIQNISFTGNELVQYAQGTYTKNINVILEQIINYYLKLPQVMTAINANGATSEEQEIRKAAFKEVIGTILLLFKDYIIDQINVPGGGGATYLVRAAPLNVSKITQNALLPIFNAKSNFTVASIAALKSIYNYAVKYELSSLQINKNNSFYGAVDIKFTEDYSYVFEINDHGNYGLREYKDNIKGRLINLLEISKEDFKDEVCKIFGALDMNDNESETNICSSILIDCTGPTNGNSESCKRHFLNIKDPSTKLRAWEGINEVKRQYLAYRILLCFDIKGKLNNEGYTTFVDENDKPFMSDDDIKKYFSLNNLTATQITDRHVQYIQKLMTTAGTIITNIEVEDDKDIYIIPSLKFQAPTVKKLKGYPFIGGNLTNIGSMKDAESIVNKIQYRTNELKKKGIKLTAKDDKYIKDKLKKFTDIYKEADDLEQKIIQIELMSSRNKKTQFTLDNIMNLRKELDKKHKQVGGYIDKMNKFLEHTDNILSN
jgi:hypothetical protein